MRASLVVAVVLSLASFALACSDSTTSPSTATDAGSSSSSSGSTSQDSGADTGPAALNGCTTFVDHTADDATRNLKWDLGVPQAPERCMKIKVGQSVKLSQDGAFTPADLGTHPPKALGGDTPSPFTDPGVDAAGNILFDQAGTFGFGCSVHASMRGVLLVVQ